jgi:pimeloyl-ACP methyl ester carboxylesterase
VKRTLAALGIIVVTLAALVSGLILLPVTALSIPPESAAMDFATARAAVATWKAEEAARTDLRAGCATTFHNTETRARNVAVLMHGFTNCPAQWEPFAKQLAAQGWAVVVPRFAGHGLIGEKPEGLKDITANNLASDALRAIDVAKGLGDRVVVTGLSSGGILALWSGSVRHVDSVVSVAPAFVPKVIPPAIGTAVDRLARIIPNMWVWWDGEAKENAPGPPYAYKAYSTKAYGEIGRIGQIVRRKTPQVRDANVSFLLNANDDSINNDAPLDVADRLRDAGATVDVTWLKGEGLPHDIVDVNQPTGNVSVTYPQIMALMQAGADA